MKLLTYTKLVLGCFALFSAPPSFAAPSFVRLTNSYSSQDGSSVYGVAYPIRPALSNDGTVVLYATYSRKDGVDTQTIQMDRIALGNIPSLIKGGHIEFPSGAAPGSDVYTSTAPSMSGNGAVVAMTSVYRAKVDGEFRDYLRVFSVGPNNTPKLIFQKSGDEIDSLNSIRVSRNGRYVAYGTVSYLEDYSVKTSLYIYDVQSETDREVLSNVVEFAEVGVRGISDDGTRILLGSVYESETAGANLSVFNVTTRKMSSLTNIQDPEAGPTSSSWDGSGVMTAFASSAPLSSADTNRALDVYLVSTANPKSLLRVSTASKQGNFSSGQPEITRNGQFVTFISRADNLRTNDLNYAKDLYVYSLGKGAIISYVAANDDINYPTANDTGSVVAFVSRASNLAPNDTNNREDIFVGRPSTTPIK